MVLPSFVEGRVGRIDQPAVVRPFLVPLFRLDADVVRPHIGIGSVHHGPCFRKEETVTVVERPT